MKFKLPALHEAVSNSKNLTKDDIRQYIFVWNGVAMTFMSPVFMVDIYEYVKQECKITDEEELEELQSIVQFLNNRSISVSSWKELTKPCDVTFNEDEEIITINKDGYKLDVIFDENNIGVQYYKRDIMKYINILSTNTVASDGLAFEGPILKVIGNIFKNESRSDIARLFLCENSSSVKFQFSKKSYIFGILNMDHETSQLNKDLTSEMNIGVLIDTIRPGLDNVTFVEPQKEELEAIDQEINEGIFTMDDDDNI